ncbi:MAG: hypothetical protein HQK72_14975 [Desulfamplus sp.]|nr:hypothetical protein [Desulfamplus sp.]
MNKITSNQENTEPQDKESFEKTSKVALPHLFKTTLENCFSKPYYVSLLHAYIFLKKILDFVKQSDTDSATDTFQSEIKKLKPILNLYISETDDINKIMLSKDVNSSIDKLYSNYQEDSSTAIQIVLEQRYTLAATIEVMSYVGHSHLLYENQVKLIQDFDANHLPYSLLNLQRLYDLDSAFVKTEYGDCLILNELARIPKVKEYFQLPDNSKPLTWDDWVKAILSQKHKLYYDEE